jgi:hypothetical protein
MNWKYFFDVMCYGLQSPILYWSLSEPRSGSRGRYADKDAENLKPAVLEAHQLEVAEWPSLISQHSMTAI